MPATLIARCLNCPHVSALPADAIFDFDTNCPDCGEMLVLEDAEGGDLDLEFEERPTLIDAEDEDEEPYADERGASPFQGLGMDERAGLDLLALAASALDPDVDLSERQFGGVREVPEVRLGESGESGRLAPTESSRLRHQREAEQRSRAAAREDEAFPAEDEDARGRTLRVPSSRLSFDELPPESVLEEPEDEDEDPDWERDEEALFEEGEADEEAALEAALGGKTGKLSRDTVPPLELVQSASQAREDAPAASAPGDLEGLTHRLALSDSVALLEGELASSAPLPSWDGGDTQQVVALAKSDPGLEGLPPLVEVESLLPTAPAASARPPTSRTLGRPEDLDELADLVELREEGTTGRMSRVYDAEEVLGSDGEVSLPDSASASPEPAHDSASVQGAPGLDPGLAETLDPEGELAKLEGADELPQPISRLFQDAEWLALLDDTLTESEEESELERRVIRISQTAAEADGDLRDVQSTLERDSAAALEALLLGSTSDARSAQRFPRELIQPETSQFNRGEPTKTFLRGEPEAEPTQSFPRGEDATKTFANAPAPSKPAAPAGKDTASWVNPEAAPAPAGSARASERPASDRMRALSGSQIRPRLVVERFHRDQLDPALVCVSDLEAPESDLFRQLYEQVFHSAVRAGEPGASSQERSPRVVLVTSARAGEGKTTVASNLAVVGARVPGEGAVLVNADPRGRGILRAFGQRASTDGLLEALSTDRDPSRYVVRFHLNELDVIPLGLRGSNAAELIASASMRQFLERLRSLYPRQSILVDGSSVLGAADPLALARMVDKVLLVVRARRTSRADVEQAIRLIGRERLAGVVLNDAAEVA